MVEEEKRYLFFRRPGVEITFDKKEGKLTGIRYNGDNMLHLREGWSLNTFRFINNDVRKWQDTQTEVISFDWKCSEDNQSAIVTIQLQETVGDVKVPYTLIYRLYGNGEIDVDASLQRMMTLIFPVCRYRPSLILRWSSWNGMVAVR